MLVRELITNAWYLSGLVARELQTVSGQQITDGLDILNDFLAEQSATGKKIPYYDRITISSVFNQQEYFINNAILVDSVTYTIKSVRYPMIRQSRYDYWATARVNDISSLPYSYYAERAVNGMKLFVYFSPDQQINEFEVTARLALAEVTLDQELNGVLDRFYTQYLKYSIAKRYCQFYNTSFSEEKDHVRQTLENSIKDVNYMDFTRTNVSPLCSSANFTYIQANLGKGWVPT